MLIKAQILLLDEATAHRAAYILLRKPLHYIDTL